MFIGTYHIIRALLLFIVFSFIFIKANKFRTNNKKVINILLVIAFFVSVSFSNILPVENLFITFKTPESVFEYILSGEILDVVHGNNSSMVIYSNGNARSRITIPKTENGYKISNGFDEKRIFHKFDEDGDFKVYNIRGTSDYYISAIVVSTENEINIFDSNREEVNHYIEIIPQTSTKIIRINHFVEGFTNDYYLLINDKKVYVAKR